jgi:regulator of protease activity HflC (stomatin/prohibitin superfamily)
MKRLALFIGIIAATTTAGCITHVDAGHVGVEVSSCSGGGVNDTPVPVGYHTTGPCTEIVEFPVYQQTMLLDKDDAINVTSSEGLPIGVDNSLSFTVDEAKAPHIYKKFRKDLANIQASYVKQAVREAMQETFAKYTAQQLYSDKKELARAEIQGLLTKKLAQDGFQVTQFTINQTRVPTEVLSAIQAKVAMTQQAQQAQQEVAKAEAVGRQKVAAAEADSTATKLRADAEAYANQKIASSLSNALVQYKLAGKWDGKLSTYAGAGGNFLFQGGH